MALTKYTYSKDANISVLADEVLADAGITTALDHIDLIDDADPDTVDIWFVDAISGAEETALNAVVSAHTNPAVPTADVVHSGIGAPDDQLGNDGDVCVDPDAMVLYKKAAGAWGAAKSIGGGGDFGTEYQKAESLGISSTTSTTYIEKLKLTTPSLPAGNYRIAWSYQISSDKQTTAVHVKIEHDDTTVVQETGYAQENLEYQDHSGFAEITLGAGVHDIDMDFRTDSGAGTGANIKDARLEIWRVS